MSSGRIVTTISFVLIAEVSSTAASLVAITTTSVSVTAAAVPSVSAISAAISPISVASVASSSRLVIGLPAFRLRGKRRNDLEGILKKVCDNLLSALILQNEAGKRPYLFILKSVSFQGILPDLFRKNQAVIATGAMQGERFVATEVLAKHDETYMPREVAEKMQAAHDKHNVPENSASTPAVPYDKGSH